MVFLRRRLFRSFFSNFDNIKPRKPFVDSKHSGDPFSNRILLSNSIYNVYLNSFSLFSSLANKEEIKNEILSNQINSKSKLNKESNKKSNLNHHTQTFLSHPNDVFYDKTQKRVFVSDTNNNRIIITDLNGKIIDFITSFFGNKDGNFKNNELFYPFKTIFVSKFNCLFVLDSNSNSVFKANFSSLKFEKVFPPSFSHSKEEGEGEGRVGMNFRQIFLNLLENLGLYRKVFQPWKKNMVWQKMAFQNGNNESINPNLCFFHMEYLPENRLILFDSCLENINMLEFDSENHLISCSTNLTNEMKVELINEVNKINDFKKRMMDEHILKIEKMSKASLVRKSQTDRNSFLPFDFLPKMNLSPFLNNCERFIFIPDTKNHRIILYDVAENDKIFLAFSDFYILPFPTQWNMSLEKYNNHIYLGCKLMEEKINNEKIKNEKTNMPIVVNLSLKPGRHLIPIFLCFPNSIQILNKFEKKNKSIFIQSKGCCVGLHTLNDKLKQKKTSLGQEFMDQSEVSGWMDALTKEEREAMDKKLGIEKTNRFKLMTMEAKVKEERGGGNDEERKEEYHQRRRIASIDNQSLKEKENFDSFSENGYGGHGGILEKKERGGDFDSCMYGQKDGGEEKEEEDKEEEEGDEDEDEDEDEENEFFSKIQNYSIDGYPFYCLFDASYGTGEISVDMPLYLKLSNENNLKENNSNDINLGRHVLDLKNIFKQLKIETMRVENEEKILENLCLLPEGVVFVHRLHLKIKLNVSEMGNNRKVIPIELSL